MFRNIMAAALTSTFLVSAPAIAATMVKEVAVTADLQAIQNMEAGEHWAGIADDIENAIVSRLTDRIADDGVRVSVEIDTVKLTTSLQSASGLGESELTGAVKVSHESDNTKFDAYDLTVTFAEAGPFYLPDVDLSMITSDSQEYYDTMVAAFAEHVVEKLD